MRQLSSTGGLSESELQVVNGNAQFSNNVYQLLAKQEGNLFFSPISAHACLSMLYLGAGGSTKEACGRTLQVSDPNVAAEGYGKVMNTLNSAERVNVTIANKAFISTQKKLKSSYKDAIVGKFQAEIDPLDFSDSAGAIGKINEWVNDKTKGKIPELLTTGDVQPSTQLVLVNAVYFKGTWLRQFEPSATKTEKFYANGKDPIDVDMMHLQGDFFTYKDDTQLDAQILQLSYTNNQYSMIVILPRERDGIAALESKLASVDLSKILDDSVSKETYLSLPKFKLETEIDFNEPLKELGLGEIFESNADLSGMLDGGDNVRVGTVKQKAYIEIDEVGSEAAASTALILLGAALVPEDQKVHFVADHPFVFLITYKAWGEPSAHNVLFYGRVEKPIPA